MQRSNENLFCFFSGFADRNIEIFDYQNDIEGGLVLLSCKYQGELSLTTGDYIQLDGVLFKIIENISSTFKASSTIELINNTSIERAKAGDKLTLGILAKKDLTHSLMWMLQPSALGEVTYNGYSIQEGHEQTLKLDFEASLDKTHLIQEDCHLGLAGSSLTAKEVITSSHLIKFSIYCGRETREKSKFNQDLPLGTSVNITEAASFVEITSAP